MSILHLYYLAVTPTTPSLLGICDLWIWTKPCHIFTIGDLWTEQQTWRPFYNLAGSIRSSRHVGASQMRQILQFLCFSHDLQPLLLHDLTTWQWEHRSLRFTGWQHSLHHWQALATHLPYMAQGLNRRWAITLSHTMGSYLAKALNWERTSTLTSPHLESLTTQLLHKCPWGHLEGLCRHLSTLPTRWGDHDTLILHMPSHSTPLDTIKTLC